MARNTAQDEQVREHVDDINGFQLPVHPDGQAFARELVNDVEHAELASVMGAILDEVVTPDVMGIFRTQPDAGSVIEPEPSFLGLLLWHFQPLPPPDPLDPLLVHKPAGLPQKSCDPAVAVAAVLGGQGDDVGRQSRLILRLFGDRSEEHTSELQSRQYLVCRLLLEKKNKRGDRRQEKLYR